MITSTLPATRISGHGWNSTVGSHCAPLPKGRLGKEQQRVLSAQPCQSCNARLATQRHVHPWPQSTFLSPPLDQVGGRHPRPSLSKREFLQAQLLWASELNRKKPLKSPFKGDSNNLLLINIPKSFYLPLNKALKIYKAIQVDIAWAFQTSSSHRSSPKASEDCSGNK